MRTATGASMPRGEGGRRDEGTAASVGMYDPLPDSGFTFPDSGFTFPDFIPTLDDFLGYKYPGRVLRSLYTQEKPYKEFLVWSGA